MTQKQKRIFAWAMAGLMTVMFVVPAVSLVASASDDDFSEERAQIADLSDQYKQLQEKQNEIQAQINAAKSEKDKQITIQNEINGQIDTTVAQIGLLNERITLLNDSISRKEVELEEKQAEIDANLELFKKRMRAMYMSGGNSSASSVIGVALGADSYSQMVMRVEVMSRVAEHDQELLDLLAQEKEELEQIKQDIESDKAEVEGDKTELDGKREELNGQMAQVQDRIHSLASMEEAFLADKENLQEQMKQVQAEINAIYEEINKTSSQIPYIGGEMAWPSRTLTQISSGFGSRFGGSDYHTGIDITGSGAYGTPILAANSGTVAVANTSYTPGYGYGIYVIIDHGGGIQTLYGHCSALNVQVGQTVVTGEQIAQVGSTGWSTGPHIHFEVRKDGQAQNPISWLGTKNG